VFIFSTNLSETFLILRRSERDMIKYLFRSSDLHVKYPLSLSDVNGTCIFSTDFRKILKYQISWKSFQWKTNCSIRTDVRTLNVKLTVAFGSFANVPKTGAGYKIKERYRLSNTAVTRVDMLIKYGVLLKQCLMQHKYAYLKTRTADLSETPLSVYHTARDEVPVYLVLSH
jgi:hypothetical protein